MLKGKVYEIVLLVIAIAIIVFLSLIINIVTASFNPVQIAYISSVAILILSIGLLLLTNKHYSNLNEQTQKMEHALQYINVLKQEVGYLTTEELIEFERKMDKGQVMIWSPEISMDIKEPFYTLIKDNIEKDIKYKYVLPNTASIKAQYQSLRGELAKEIDNIGDKLTVVYLPEKFIVHGITLYINNEDEMGVLNVPHREFEKKYFIMMDAEFFNRTRECINETIETLGESG